MNKNYAHYFFFPFSFFLALTVGSSVFAQKKNVDLTGLDDGKPKAKVMVLGTSHFANNNRDVVKTNYEDVLIPKRQAEVRELVEKIKKFKPTKIVLEQEPSYCDTINMRYRNYVDGKDTLKRNEIYQLGFRMAKDLGHKRVYCGDYQLDMNFDTLFTTAKKYNQTRILGIFASFMETMQKQTNEQAQWTLLKQFRWMNDPKLQEKTHRLYILQLEVGNGTDYVGTMVTAGWYERNLKIATNVLHLIESPNDRVLMIFGAGHAKLLRQFLSESPSVELVEAAPYLK